jgi:hypothetical protein
MKTHPSSPWVVILMIELSCLTISKLKWSTTHFIQQTGSISNTTHIFNMHESHILLQNKNYVKKPSSSIPCQYLLLCPLLHLMTASIYMPTDIFHNAGHKSMGMHIKHATNQRCKIVSLLFIFSCSLFTAMPLNSRVEESVGKFLFSAFISE